MAQNREPRSKHIHLWSVNLWQRRQENTKGKRRSLRQIVLGKLNSNKQSIKSEYFFTSYTKINLNWFKDLNIRLDTITFLEENISKTFSDVNHSNICSQGNRNKSKNNQMEPNQTQKLLYSIESHQQKKRHHMGWKKIFANNLIGRAQFLKYTNKSYNSVPKQATQSTKWMADINTQFSKEDIQMANRHMKGCSTSLIIREMRCHLTPVRMAISKKSVNNKQWRGCEEKGTFLHCLWEGKLVEPLGRRVWRLLFS